MIPFLLAQATPAPSPEDTLEKTIAYGLNITHEVLIYCGAALAIYVVVLWIGRILKRRLNVPLGWIYHLFAISLALFVPAQLPWVVFPSTENALCGLTVMSFSIVLVIFVRHYFFGAIFRQRQNTSVPKFLSEIVSVGIIGVAIFFVLDGIYGVEVPGLLAGAGVVGIVLGLALQDTLGNVFSGFAIYFGGQFKTGDWLLIGEDHAQIVETNWRSTRLRTLDDVYFDIPNSNITKDKVINFNYPTNLHGQLLEIGLDYDTPPEKVKTVLIDAALNCPHVLKSPAPNVYLKEFGNWSITYQLRFWLDDHSLYRDAFSEMRMSLWYALRRHKISIPYPIQGEYHYEAPVSSDDDKEVIRRALSGVPFYSCLSDMQVDQLVCGARLVTFGKDEAIIRQGEDAGPMYMLVDGRAEVFVEINGAVKSVARIGAGDSIGEVSVLTGEPRSATVRALGHCCAVEVGKETLAVLLEASPELLHRLSDLLAKRRMQNEGIAAEASGATNLAEKQEDYRAGFLKKLKSFFEL